MLKYILLSLIITASTKEVCKRCSEEYKTCIINRYLNVSDTPNKNCEPVIDKCFINNKCEEKGI